jgi:hypothetical protein
MKSAVKLEHHTITSSAVALRGVRITPEATVLSLRLPFGAFVWNRPRAVLVEEAGAIRRVPMRDITRITQVVLWACVVVCAVVTRIVIRKEHAS